MGSNAKAGSASKVKIEKFEDLFGGSAGQENSAEQIINAPLADLHTFKDHPFRVVDDEKMEETTESIRQYGVLVPGIARPRAGGGYEIIAGHRRKRGSELAGKMEMPVIVRNYTDDEATIIMVDSNIQREDILPSEKARAYKMKYEAMKHQGSKGEKFTADLVGEAAGESGRTVQRYIRLTELIAELLDAVDHKVISMKVAEKLSYLSVEEQGWVWECVKTASVQIQDRQAECLKTQSKQGLLDPAMVQDILMKKTRSRGQVTIPEKRIADYFPATYNKQQIEEVIYLLLEQWKKRQEGEKDGEHNKI